MRITLQPGFVLHTRPFNETSLLLDVFTLTHGRISLIAKGARVARTRFRGLLRPFVPLSLSWSGKTELMCLSAAELQNPPCHPIAGNDLFSGIYLNELLVRALPRFDPYPAIFHAYQKTLANLHATQLRLFEKIVLCELGYGFSLDKETANGMPIQPEQWYEFMPGKGLSQCASSFDKQAVFKGKSLLALHDEKLETGEDLRAAKTLHRMAIRALLGERDLKSRVFFQIREEKLVSRFLTE